MLPAERHRLAKQRKKAHFIQPPWHIWVLADTETGPGCGGLGWGRPCGGLCCWAGRRAHLWGGFGGCIWHLGGTPLSAQQALPWNPALAEDPEPCLYLLRGQRAVGKHVWGWGGPGAVCWPVPKPGASRGSSPRLPTQDPAVLAPPGNSRKTAYCLEDLNLK